MKNNEDGRIRTGAGQQAIAQRVFCGGDPVRRVLCHGLHRGAQLVAAAQARRQQRRRWRGCSSVSTRDRSRPPGSSGAAVAAPAAQSPPPATAPASETPPQPTTRAAREPVRPTETPAPVAATPAEPVPGETYLQVMAVKQEAAEVVARTLKAKGFPTVARSWAPGLNARAGRPVHRYRFARQGQS